MLIPELASLEDTSQDILDALESVAPSLAACEDSFADAAEFADRMADDSVRLAQEDTPLVLEAAFSSSEGVMEAAEELESSLNSLFTGFEHAAEEAQSFTQNTHLDETTAEQDIKKLIESLKSMRMRVKDITGSLRDSSSVLSSIADEYSHFRDAHTSLLDEIRNLLRTIRRLAVAASAYETIASELETISLAASVETARAGESAVGFSTIPQRLEDIARRSRESAGQIRDFTDNLESSAELCSDYLAQQSEIIPSSIEHLIDDVTAFVEKELTDYSNSIEESISSGMEVSGHSNSFGNLIRDAADKSNEITESFNQIVSQINECRKVIGNTFEKCEHICAIIEELYPEEL
jgi:methyl-accepting chemotaxis protein